MAKEPTYKPVPPDKYTGKQAIINSDRVLINARTDSVMIFAKQSVSLSSAGTLNFDSDSTCIINSPKIQLGLNAEEPLILGTKATTLLRELLEGLDDLTDKMQNIQVHVGDKKYELYELNVPAIRLNTTLKNLLKDLDDIKSKKNFTL